MIQCVPIYEFFDSNCYFYIDDDTNHGFLIDPGAEPDKLLALILRKGWVIEKILLTHGHIDHIGGVNDIRKVYELPVYAHRKCTEFMMDEELNLSSIFGPPIQIEGIQYLDDGDEVCLDTNL